MEMEPQQWVASQPAAPVATGAADAGTLMVENRGQLMENNPSEDAHVPQLPAFEANAPPRKKRKVHTPTVPRLLLKKHDNETEKLETNQALLETSARVDGAVSELIKYCDILSDKSSKNAENRTEAIQNIRESILPMLHIASCSLRDTGMSFAPFGGLRNLHGRHEAQRKQAVVDKSCDKSPALQLINDFVQRSIVEIPEHISRYSSAPEPTTEQNDPSPSAHKVGEADKAGDTETIRIIRPRNGTLYTRPEALRVAKLYKKGSRQRGLAVRAMIARGWAPVAPKTIYRLCQADEEGHPIVDEDWRANGRPPAVKVAGATLPAPLGRPSPSEMVEVVLKKTKKGDKREHTTEAVKKQSIEHAPTMPMELRVVSETMRKAAASADSSQGFGEVGPASQAPSKKPPAPHKHKPKKKSTKKSSKEDQIESFVQGRVKAKKEEYCDNVINFPLPPPADGGKVYKKSEAVHIAKQYQRGSTERRWAIKAMLYRGYVPNSMKTMYRLLQRDEKGLPIVDSPWGRPGCPALLDNDEVDAIIERLKEENGRIYGKADVERIIVHAVREKIAKQGRDPDVEPIQFNHSTLRNYETLFRSKLSSVYWKE